MGAFEKKIAAAGGVAVEIHDGFLLEFCDVGLDPFSRTEEAGLFAVPDAVNDGAAGLPALLDQLAEGAGFFEFGGGAGDGIVCAIDPGVVMVAANDPLVRLGAAGDLGDDVVEGLGVPVGEHLEVNFGFAGGL